MDHTNPAVSSLTQMSPALLADMDNDPALLKGIAAVMSAIQLEKLHHLAMSPTTPTGQKIQIFEATTKVAEVGAYGKASQQVGDGVPKFSVTINIPDLPKTTTKTIEVIEDALLKPLRVR